MKTKLISLVVGLFAVSSSYAVNNIDGTWATDCTAMQGQYLLSTIVVAGNNMKQSSESYLDAACASKGLEAVITSTANFGKESTVTVGAKEVDTIISSLTLAAHDPRYVSYFNSTSFCGYTDWIVG